MRAIHIRRVYQFASLLLLVGSVGCAGREPGKISSTIDTGHPILSFPNRDDHIGTTVLSSNPHAQQAGVNGRALTISVVDLNLSRDVLTIDLTGNLGIGGTFHSLSSRIAKQHIRPFAINASDIVDRSQVVQFNYKSESSAASPHVGFIAENAPFPIADRDGRSIDLNSAVAVAFKADQELLARVRALEHDIRVLRAEQHARREASTRGVNHRR